MKFEYNESTYNCSDAEIILPMVFQSLNKPIQSMVDVGCGIGTWISVAEKLGVSNVLGIDGGHINQSNFLSNYKNFQNLDIRKPIKLNEKFDLAISLEVGEHLDAEHSDSYVESLTTLSDVVLFSSAIPFQGGCNHINEQWPEYWVNKFEAFGFKPYDCIRNRIWNDNDIKWWYKQNIMLFSSLDLKQTSNDPLALVHPGLFMETSNRLISLEAGKAGVFYYIKLLMKSLFKGQ